MIKLYALSFKGRMLYFYGDVQEEMYDQIEHISNTIDKTLSIADFCEIFTAKILCELDIELIKCPVTRIFRVR